MVHCERRAYFLSLFPVIVLSVFLNLLVFLVFLLFYLVPTFGNRKISRVHVLILVGCSIQLFTTFLCIFLIYRLTLMGRLALYAFSILFSLEAGYAFYIYALYLQKRPLTSHEFRKSYPNTITLAVTLIVMGLMVIEILGLMLST